MCAKVEWRTDMLLKDKRASWYKNICPSQRNVKHLSAQEMFVVSLQSLHTCISVGLLCNLGSHRPPHVSHYWLADSLIGDKAAF